MKKHFVNFFCGFLSTHIFHQGLLGLIFIANLAPVKPFNMGPTDPFGVPAILSLAFFGGLWGVLIGYLIRKDAGKMFWLKAIIMGAIFPTAIALLVVYPLKGISFNPRMLPISLILNAVWGLGLAILIKLSSRLDKQSSRTL